MKYILNPGDMKDARVFDERLDAENALIDARELDASAQAYRFSRGAWQRYDIVMNRWYDERDATSIPIKVLESS